MIYYIVFSLLVSFGITIMEEMEDKSYQKFKKLPKIIRFLIFILVNAVLWPIYFGMTITMIKELDSKK